MKSNNSKPIDLPDPEAIASRLVSEWGSAPASVNGIVEKIMRMDADLKREFLQWWDTGIVPDIAEGGFSVYGLLDSKRVRNVAVALTVMDWLRKDPKEASEMLSRPVVYREPE